MSTTASRFRISWAITALALALSMLVLGLPGGMTPAAASSGGPIILDGTDVGLHGSFSGGELQTTWRYTGVVYPVLFDAVARAHDDWVAVIGAEDSTTTSNNCGGMVHYVSEATDIDVVYHRGVEAIDDLFEGLGDGSLRPAFLHIVEQGWCGNGLSSVEAARLTNHASAIAEFVNAGGGLFAQDHSYGWLTALLPDATKSGAGGSNPQLTAAGNEAFPALTNADINAPYHGQFGGDFSPLEVLAQEGETVIIIGGLEVALPSAISVSGGGEKPLGSTADLVVSVKDGDDNPVVGGEVDMLVLSGPNNGATDTKTTGGAGTATFSLTSAVTGVDSVRFTHDGTNATADVTWVEVPITLPSAPQNLSASPGDGKVALSWTAPGDVGGGTISGYEIEYRVAGGDWIVVGTTDGTEATLSDLENGTQYEFRVAAINEAGTGPFAASDAVKPNAPSQDDPKDEPEDELEKGVKRIHGEGRVDTAVELSKATFNPGVPVVYIVNSGAFSDGLAAGPLAAAQGGPILLTGKDELPAATIAELKRLEAGIIVILGGTAVVSEAVEDALGELTEGAVLRLGGPDRYGTSAQISADAFEPGVPLVYVATGREFADSLSGGPSAALAGGPILLVEPDRIPDVIVAELQRLEPGGIVILGGTAAVSAAVEEALAAYTEGSVSRLHGPDRFGTSAAISQETFTAPIDVVYIATGLVFADALAGTPAVHAREGALLLVHPLFIPEPVAAELERLGPSEIFVFGGTGAVSEEVFEQLHEFLR